MSGEVMHTKVYEQENILDKPVLKYPQRIHVIKRDVSASQQY